MFKNTIRSKFFITLLVLLALVFSTFSFASAASATGKMGDRRLSVGCRGTDVSTLQTALKDKGFFNHSVTGYFGPVTKNAVFAYQKATKKLYPYGVADFATIKYLMGDKTTAASPTPATGSQSGAWVAPKGLDSEIILATTTSTQDSGLLNVLIPHFEKKANVKVKVVAVGTGQAIQLAKDGNADVLLVHSRKDEDAFIKDGYGSYAWDVMYNQFLIVGPSKDPASIKDMKDAAKALKQIGDKGAKFVSRGDNSGTHKKELTLWSRAEVDVKNVAGYVSAGQGMGATLKMADELGAYTLTDEATYLTAKGIDLPVLVKGDPYLFNPYGMMIVNSSKKQKTGKALIDFFVSGEGQKMIGEFEKSKYGRSIFVPNGRQR